MVQVAEKDFNLKMEHKRFWEEISTTHTYLFDRQDREVEILKTGLTVEDFKEHFSQLFFSPSSKRLDLQLTSTKHDEKQAEWAAKNAQSTILTHVSVDKRVLVASVGGIEAFKMGQALYSDVYKTNFA